MSLDERGHINGTFWYSEEKKLAFFAVPKNASTALRNSIGPTDAKYYFDEGVELGDDVVKFTVIREPVDRFVSAYLEVLKRAIIDCPGTRGKKFYTIRDEKERFKEFINEIDKNGFWENHARPQSFYLSDKDGNILDLDFVFNFNQIADGLDKMAEETGIRLTPKREWFHHPGDKQIVHSYIDDELRERIKKIYAKDFELYEKSVLSE